MKGVITKLSNNNEYDNFLEEIQKEKMKELWDNKKDEFWNRLS